MHSMLCAALSSNVGAWGMFALSFIIEWKKFHIPKNLKILIQNVKCLIILKTM